ncbi:MAG TPA: hypothetical protein VFF12_07130 [Myxococcaceae bacterium]|nr:hypothetical protein [Myxococcaceae bacterium]
MNLPSFILPHPSESRAGGLALSAALLALPALVAGHARAGVVLLAASVVAAAVFVERRTHASSRAREVPSRSLSLVPSPSRSSKPHPAPQARWEMVERDGQRSLSMRWS